MSASASGGMFIGTLKTQWLGLLLGLFSFVGGYQVRGYQVQQHEARIAALELSAPSGREWQELNNRLERIERKIDRLGETKQDKK